MKIFRRLFLLLAAAALAIPASAQIIAKKVTFAGVPQNQADLLAYSGLAPGKALSHADIDAAAQKLMDTGLFGNIQYKYDGVELLFNLTPTDGALPVAYANFPWWDDASLTAAIAAKVPLFHGSLPADSSLQALVVSAMTAMLAQKGVQATVTAMPSEDNKGNASGIVFHIDAPAIQVGAVTLSGASPGFADPVAAIEKAAGGQKFDAATESTLTAALKAIYHRQGYLEEAMNGFAHATPQVTGDKVLVPVSAAITEGPQYKVASITLAGASTFMSQDDFAKSAKLHAGDVANEDLLRATLASLANPYRAHGYLRAKIDAAPRFDAATHTVSYAVTVEPGPVFHMGELSLINLSNQQRADVMKFWPLQEGDVYDATVAINFLVKNKVNLHSLDGWSATWKAFEHEDTQVVDLVVTFQQGGTLN